MMNPKKNSKAPSMERLFKISAFFLSEDVVFHMGIHDDKVCVHCNDVDKWLALDGHLNEGD